MKRIGITGSIGTGKSYVSKLITGRGYKVIDADIVAREVLESSYSTLLEIEKEFGNSVINNNRTLNRAKLGEIVFSNADKLTKLNAIMHPKINDRIGKLCNEAARNGEEVLFIDIPLLFENKLESIVDQIIVVATDEETQLERVCSRDNLSEENALKRIHSQIPISEKIKLGNYLIDNSGSRRDTVTQLERILSRI